MHMYRIVLAEGQREDVAAYLNRDLLRQAVADPP